MGLLGAGGGINLGSAHGVIRITTNAGQAAIEVRRASGDIEISLNRVGASAQSNAKKSVSAFKSISDELKSLRGDTAAVGLAGAALVGLGFKAAAGWERYNIIFKNMLGSQREANRLMDQLKQKADAAGISYEDMFAAARRTLILTKGNTEELEKWLMLTRRLATVEPLQGMEGASFAINEWVSSGGTDLVSIADRFGLNKKAFRDALEMTGGDFAAALDMILDDIGATEQAADEMANSFTASFTRMKNSVTSLLGDEAAEYLDEVTTLFNIANKELKELHEQHPEIIKLGFAFAGIAAVGAPLLLFTTRVIEAFGTIVRLGGLIGGLKLAAGLPALGPLAASVGIGAGVGTFAGLELGRHATMALSDDPEVDERMRSASHEDLFGYFIDGLKNMAFQLEHAEKRLGMVFGDLVSTVGLAVQALANIVMAVDPAAAKLMVGAGKMAFEWGQSAMSEEEFEKWRATRLAEMSGTHSDSKEDTFGNKKTGDTFDPDPLAPTDDELAAFDQYQQDLTEIAEDAQADRIAEEADYQERLTDLNEDYNEAREKIAEDAQDRILDLEQQTADQIADIRENAADREAKENEDYSERISELQTEYQKDELRRLADFQREEQRARRQHNLTLLMAAANLDAKAIWQENMRYNQQRSDAQEDFNIETDRRAEQLQERLRQEQEGHEDRLEEARKADEKRIEDLREHLAEERLEIQEDAAEKLEELQMQHERELLKLQEKHLAELAAIDAQEKAVTDKRTAAFKAELDGLGDHYDDMIGVSETKQEQLRKDFEAWIDSLGAAIPGAVDPYDEHLNKVLPGGGGTSTGGTPADPGHEDGPGNLGGYARGGLVPRTGRALLHAHERVLSADMTAMINRMAGGHSDTALARALSGGSSGRGGSKIINVENFITPVLPGMNPREVQQAAYDALSDLLKDIAGDD